jgi:hypothetical protein
VSFGKLASTMDLTKDDAISCGKISRAHSRTWSSVEAVLDRFMAKLPDQDHVRWIHLPANNMFWVEVNGHRPSCFGASN